MHQSLQSNRSSSVCAIFFVAQKMDLSPLGEMANYPEIQELFDMIAQMEQIQIKEESSSGEEQASAAAASKSTPGTSTAEATAATELQLAREQERVAAEHQQELQQLFAEENRKRAMEEAETAAKRVEHDQSRFNFISSLPVNHADRLVIIDLEWHARAKPLPDSEPDKKSVLTSHICQIAAFTSNMSIRFNQYIKYLELEDEWMRLVRRKSVHFSPQDDPRIAITGEQCIEDMINTFHDDTLFLSYGTTDAKSIFDFLLRPRTFHGTATYPVPLANQQHRQQLLDKITRKRWTWANVIPWIKNIGESLDIKDFKIQGSLSSLHETFFYKSLLVTVATKINPYPEIAENERVQKLVKKRTCEFPQSLQTEDRYGLVPRDWLEVKDDSKRNTSDERLFKNCYPESWNTGHLQHVIHVGHTDAIMTIALMAILSIADEEKNSQAAIHAAVKAMQSAEQFMIQEGMNGTDKQTSLDRVALEKCIKRADEADGTQPFIHFLATSLLAKTWCFRRYQLALSNAAAKKIREWYETAYTKNATGTQLFIKVGKSRKPVALVKSSEEMIRGRRLELLVTTTATTTTTGDTTQSVSNEYYEVEKVIGHRDKIWEKDGKFYRCYMVHWKGYSSADDSEEWAQAFINGERNPAIKEYWKEKKEVNNAEGRQDRRSARVLAPDPPATGVTTATTSNSSPETDQDMLRAHQQEEENDALVQAEIERSAHPKRLYFTSKDITGKQMHLLQTQRSGAFTDKVKAIRTFIAAQALKEKDEDILKQFQHSDQPFQAETTYPRNSFIGKPWYAFPTTQAAPNTTILHEQSCKVMSDPLDASRTRNFLEMNPVLFDFDQLRGVTFNTKFRFCKECKQYKPPSDVQASAAAASASSSSL
jgi:hypothetical protein